MYIFLYRWGILVIIVYFNGGFWNVFCVAFKTLVKLLDINQLT